MRTPWTATEAVGTWEVTDDDCRCIAPFLTEAEALLIAAAPELLAALIACEDQLVRDSSTKAWPAIEAARAALAKAEPPLEPPF